MALMLMLSIGDAAEHAHTAKEVVDELNRTGRGVSFPIDWGFWKQLEAESKSKKRATAGLYLHSRDCSGGFTLGGDKGSLVAFKRERERESTGESRAAWLGCIRLWSLARFAWRQILPTLES